MGTDIHLYVERRDRYRDEDEAQEGEKPPAWDLMMHEDCAFGGRNYNVFAVLADVRNGRGFAGIKTGDGFNVIAEPRGLPEDMSPEMRRHAEAYCEHTPSWLTLKEVLEFDWTQTSKHCGWVGPVDFLRWKRDGKPYSWSGGVSGSMVRKVPNSEMLSSIEAAWGRPLDELALPKRRDSVDALAPLGSLYTLVEWTETYEESCADFLAWARALVERCGYFVNGERWERKTPGEEAPEETAWRDSGAFAYAKPEDVRFVFWFDS